MTGTSASYVLLQYGGDPSETRYEDLEGRAAFSVTQPQVEQTPNLIVKLTREAQWAQQHREIMGPNNSYFYFGPAKSPGYLVYGNGPTQSMVNSIKQKKDGSTSRYFTAQNGKEYKWRVAPQRLECVDSSRNIVAFWELGQLEDQFNARLTIKASGLAIVTEILTTLTLNRMAQAFSWAS